MSRRNREAGDPRQHTAVISDVQSMWEKLTWDVVQFDELQRSMPDLPQPLGFAAINVCLSASSLRDWTATAWVKARRASGKPASRDEVVAYIYAHVPQQRMCEAIANTAKHSMLDTGGWPDGRVELVFEEGDDIMPPGYVLRHIHEGGQYDSIALNAFTTMQRCWWGALQNLGFAFSANPIAFEWRQRQIRAVFGDR